MLLVQVFLLHQVAPEEPPLHNAWPEEAADPVVDVIAEHRCQEQQAEECGEVERRVGTGGQGTCNEQERIARKERHDHQTGLNENDEEQQPVNEVAMRRDEHRQCDVQVGDEEPELL